MAVQMEIFQKNSSNTFSVSKSIFLKARLINQGITADDFGSANVNPIKMTELDKEKIKRMYGCNSKYRPLRIQNLIHFPRSAFFVSRGNRTLKNLFGDLFKLKPLGVLFVWFISYFCLLVFGRYSPKDQNISCQVCFLKNLNLA